MKDNSLKNLQKVEFEMLNDVASFCDENNIQYFIICGTLLGAVRNGGFIPWDDDIDIGMDLKNYKRFLKLAKNNLPKKYFIQHFSTDRKVDFPWIKVRINNTTCMETKKRSFDIHAGIGMDVFLVNGISNNKIRYFAQAQAEKFQRVLLVKHYYKECNIAYKSTLRKMIHRIYPEFMRMLTIKLLDYVINYDLEKSTFCYNTYNMYLENCYKFVSRWFQTVEKIPFEDELFYAPKNRIDYLEARYGKWQELPPEDERKGHGEMIIDLNNDYSVYYINRKKR